MSRITVTVRLRLFCGDIKLLPDIIMSTSLYPTLMSKYIIDQHRDTDGKNMLIVLSVGAITLNVEQA